MSTVTRSAAISATQLFGTITTTANAVSTAVNAVGNLFDELQLRSAHRLNGVRESLALEAITQSEFIRDDAAIALGLRYIEREKQLAADPNLKAAYDKAMEVFKAKLEPAAA